MRHSGVRHAWLGIVVGLGLLGWVGSGAAAECKPPRTLTATVLEIKYCADPAFTGVIQSQVQKIRQDIRAQRQAGKLVIYASTPISPRGGGNEKVNLEIAASVKVKLEKEYGSVAWVLDPGKYQLPSADGRAAGGGEYMVMWTDVLAGEDGTGKDFDMVHFTGPGDMRAFFGCGKDDVGGCIERYLETRGAADEAFRRDVAANPQRRAAFIRYYAMRASSAYSSGAHDEWNIFVKVNRRRPLGEQVAVFFDGRAASPAEMEVEISPGYEVR
ncbi:MAG: hypothetical protein HY002_03445 [Candidatus Rokubacteria bacterium]|nr:hypothetical protein [Candidatus Rokubacteria bacterium]